MSPFNVASMRFLTLVILIAVLAACGSAPASVEPTPTAVVLPTVVPTATRLPATVEITATALVAQTAPITTPGEVTATLPVSETVTVVEALKSAEAEQMDKIIATVEQVAKEHGIEVFADQTVNLPLLGGAKRAIRLGGDKVPRPPEMPTEDGDMLAGEELSLAQREAMANRGLELIVQEHPDLDLAELVVIDPQYENDMGENVTLPELKVQISIMSNSVSSADILASALNEALAGQVEAKLYHPEGTGIGAYFLLDSETGLYMNVAGLFDNVGEAYNEALNDNSLRQIGTISSTIGNKLIEMAGGEENADLARVITLGVITLEASDADNIGQWPD